MRDVSSAHASAFQLHLTLPEADFNTFFCSCYLFIYSCLFILTITSIGSFQLKTDKTRDPKSFNIDVASKSILKRIGVLELSLAGTRQAA
jgi:hypothetical protein